MLPFPLTIRFADGKPARAGNVGYRSITPRGSTFGPFGPSVSPLERLGTGQRWVPVGHASGLDLRALRALGLAPRRFGDGATFGTGRSRPSKVWGRGNVGAGLFDGLRLLKPLPSPSQHRTYSCSPPGSH